MIGGSTNYPMGLLEEVGSLGSLEEDEDSSRTTNPLLMDHSKYTRASHLDNLDKSQT